MDVTIIRDVQKCMDSTVAVVTSLLGPGNNKVLLVKGTGDVAITSDGATLLGALSLSHPIARLDLNFKCSYNLAITVCYMHKKFSEVFIIIH